MKASVLIACIAVVAAFALLAACQPSISATASCEQCHSGDTEVGQKVLAAKAQYENSGHFNGPRVFAPASITWETYEFEGSNAMYANGSSCSKCHTDQGFVYWVQTGTTKAVSAASQPRCFTCHSPHETEDYMFPPRTQTASTLVDGTSYNNGTGNLCAICHQSRTAATAFLTGPKTWSANSGPHHGPQADVLVGANNWEYTLTPVTYAGASPHYTNASAQDSCVTCHMFRQSSGNFSGSLELAGHGMYLTGVVHGSSKDIINSCKTCHVASGPGSPWPSATTAVTFDTSGHTFGDVDGDGSTEDQLLEIRGLEEKLITYFSTASEFTSSIAPIVAVSGGTLPGEWFRDWVFNPEPTAALQPQLTLVQSQSFWNFKLHIEDRSGGVHNSRFATQILYDAIQNLNDNGEAIPLGTRP